MACVKTGAPAARTGESARSCRPESPSGRVAFAGENRCRKRSRTRPPKWRPWLRLRLYVQAAMAPAKSITARRRVWTAKDPADCQWGGANPVDTCKQHDRWTIPIHLRLTGFAVSTTARDSSPSARSPCNGRKQPPKGSEQFGILIDGARRYTDVLWTEPFEPDAVKDTNIDTAEMIDEVGRLNTL